MTYESSRSANLPEPSVVPLQGWHCSHFFYRWNRRNFRKLSKHQRAEGSEQFRTILGNLSTDGPKQLQTMIVSGHKADFGLVMLDSHPLVIERMHQRLLQSELGVALEPTYSFVSLTEVSEYLPTKEQFSEKLIREGEDPTTPAFEAKVNSYERRLPMMLQQRLYPELPTWPAFCFYPMNKARKVGANWFLLPFSERAAMMAEHGQSGMAFGGRVTQIVTAAIGLDDWEWGVSLWARNPQYLKEIVYVMRFDQASARFGQFGPFYAGYISSPSDILHHCLGDANDSSQGA